MTHPPRPGSPLPEHLYCTSLISNCQSTCCLQILEHQANLSVNGHLSQRMLPCDEIVTWPGCTLYIVQPQSDENTTGLLERLGFGQQREPLEARLDSSVCQILNHWQKLLEDFFFVFFTCGFKKTRPESQHLYQQHSAWMGCQTKWILFIWVYKGLRQPLSRGQLG